ncbi:MAG: hypothetical protein AB7U79_08430 [Candidatus Izemoplasmatales bacterium]
MKKALFVILLTLSILSMIPQISMKVKADSYVSVEILSPSAVTSYPGYETTIQAKVTNNTSTDLTNLVVYITMVDLTKNMTVNLEDYNASVPVVIDRLVANSSMTVDLPIILVYPDTFHLYVTVANVDTLTICSSDAIVTNIMSQASIDPTLITYVSSVTPVMTFLLALGVLINRKRKVHL